MSVKVTRARLELLKAVGLRQVTGSRDGSWKFTAWWGLPGERRTNVSWRIAELEAAGLVRKGPARPAPGVPREQWTRRIDLTDAGRQVVANTEKEN